MRDLVNRRDKEYHFDRLNSITDLDKIASFLLAITWSRSHSQTRASQGLIQMDCVACVYVGGDLWVSSNGNTISLDDIAELRKELGYDIDIYIVRNGNGHMHAEMQLISQMYVENVMCNPAYMGVSKPCCEYCKSILDQYNISYTSWHQSYVKNWENPI